MNFIEQMVAALSNLEALRRKQQIGPGVRRTWICRTPSQWRHTRYTGAILRATRASNGVGRPRRFA